MLASFGFATTLDRVAAYSRVIDAHRLKMRLNVEDAPVIGAVLGHALGITQRVRKTRDRARWLTYRRAVNWHVVAPPFGGEAGLATRTSDAVLFEEHRFGAHEGWKQSAWGHVLRQGAPAVVARGTGLPGPGACGEGLGGRSRGRRGVRGPGDVFERLPTSRRGGMRGGVRRHS